MEEKSADFEYFDVLIIGAGVSGINCAYRLQTQAPSTSFTVLEGRGDVGGTWDLFKYPGIRSDSDLYTYGFEWAPWPYDTPIAEGPLVKQYLRECAAQEGIDRHIHFNHRVLAAHWSSESAQWTITVSHDDLVKEYRGRFLIMGTGYYDYEKLPQVKVPGIEDFKGDVLHPQFWPEDYDYTGKKMAIIGSGATAITLFPNLAKKAAQVAIIQRTPSYIIASDNSANPKSWSRRLLPRAIILRWERYRRMTLFWIFVLYCKYFPKKARALLHNMTVPQLPLTISHDPHFEPWYYPWQQRLCISPDGDFFKALHRPGMSMVTGYIDTVTENGIRMKEGTSIEADAIITATGFRMELGGHIAMTVDGEEVNWGRRLLWNGTMVQDIPNMLYMIGYTNSSWTLGADNAAHILLRLMAYMKRKDVKAAVPRAPPAGVSKTQKMWALNSTYVEAAQERLPQCGYEGPWRPRRENPPIDYVLARYGDITSCLQFSA
ncbi:putative flavin-binding monooxygenase [Xylariaceae sp. FL0016]|nr:putative flavin-binding monooxygenase [Xylariaceae sp. FL0016]